MPAGQPPSSTAASALMAGLGARLRAARLRRRLTSGQLAERAGVSRMTLFRAEKGEAAVALGTYLRILEVLRLEGDIALLAKADELGHRMEQRAQPQGTGAGAKAISFPSVEALSGHQRDRELAEALQARSLPPGAFARWLQSSWGRLQQQADTLYTDVPYPSGGPALHFRTLKEKNDFDAARETEFAVRVAARHG
jgi:transcriptional regulator with XRE-family HTH domain